MCIHVFFLKFSTQSPLLFLKIITTTLRLLKRSNYTNLSTTCYQKSANHVTFDIYRSNYLKNVYFITVGKKVQNFHPPPKSHFLKLYIKYQRISQKADTKSHKNINHIRVNFSLNTTVINSITLKFNK